MPRSRAIYIAYVTLDEVNRYDAMWIAPDGVTVELHPVTAVQSGRFDGCVYDLDRFPEKLRKSVIENLTQAPPPLPSAIHSLWLRDEEATALRRNGVRVHRRLEAAVFEGFLQDSSGQFIGARLHDWR